MTRRTLIHRCLAVLTPGLHAAKLAAKPLDSFSPRITPNNLPRSMSDPEYGNWETQWLTGDTDGTLEGTNLFDDCGRRVQVASFCFVCPPTSGKRVGRDMYRGCLYITWQAQGVTADEPRYESQCFSATMRFRGEAAFQFGACFDRVTENRLTVPSHLGTIGESHAGLHRQVVVLLKG